MRSLLIDKNALRANLNEVRARAGSADIVADLSGDGQGVGLLRMARFLQEEGLGSFAVSETQDAALLRRSGFSEERILMLRSVTNPGQLQELMDAEVIFTLGSYEAGIALNALAGERHTVAEARIRIDTGLGQYGFLPRETDKMLTLYRQMPNIAISGLYTLPASTNILSETQKQVEEFMTAARALQEQGVNTGVLMALDSAALFRGEFGEQNAVCIGSALIGRVPVKAGSGLTRVGVLEASLEELKWLEINVDVLSTPEPIGGKEELDVKRYGVIVSSGSRRGLLLPDLDGVDTVDEQVDIARRKAGIREQDPITLERFEVVRHV